MGMTTVRSIMRRARADRPHGSLVYRRLRPAQPLHDDVGGQARAEQSGQRQADDLAVGAQVFDGTLSVVQREKSFTEVADAAADADGDQETRNADAGDAREQDENLERR